MQPSTTNRLVAVIHTKPVIANCVQKLIAMATSLSTSGPPPNTIPWAQLSPQPKWHLDHFSHFCTDNRRVPLYFTMGCPFPLQGVLPKQHLDRFSRFCRAHYCDRPTDHPRYL